MIKANVLTPVEIDEASALEEIFDAVVSDVSKRLSLDLYPQAQRQIFEKLTPQLDAIVRAVVADKEFRRRIQQHTTEIVVTAMKVHPVQEQIQKMSFTLVADVLASVKEKLTTKIADRIVG